MNKFAEKLKDEEDRSGNTDYGNIFLISAIALFIVFAAFKGSMVSTVQNVAGDFVSKFDSLRVADTGRPNL
jgi:hypothetical protein